MLYDLFSYAITNGDLNWSNTKNMNNKVNKIRDIMWMICVLSIHDIESWKQCLKAKLPEEGNDAIWLAWLIQAIICDFLRNPKTLDFKNILRVLKQHFPKYIKLIPIWLISEIHNLHKSNKIRQKLSLDLKYNVESIQEGLSMISLDDVFLIDSELLQNTIKWDIRHEEIDILEGFSQCLDELYDRKILEDESLYEQTKQFIQKLIERREREKVTE